ADVKNAAGKYITPSIQPITEALGAAKIPDDFRFSMVNPPGEKSYPIAGATWLLVYEQQKDPAKGKKIVEFLNWAITQGEGMAATLDYAPLPDNVQKRILERIKQIKYDPFPCPKKGGHSHKGEERCSSRSSFLLGCLP